jgi:hypothetical protein
MLDLIHFITLHWTEEHPYLQYRTDPQTSTTDMAEVIAGRLLSITIDAVRLCIGYYDFVQRQRFSCPDQRRLGDKYAQCFRCQRREVTYYAITGHAEDPRAAQAYLDTQAHQAYLNLFGHSLLKVGVASEGRNIRRTVEQGALASLFFARANGTDIRELERYISRELRVKDRVTTLQKVRRLAELQTAEQAQANLRQAMQRITQQLPPHLQQYLLPQPSFHFHQDKYRLQLPPATTEVNLVKQPVAADILSGLMRGVVGNLLILEAPDQRIFVAPMKQLQGYLLTVEPELKSMRLRHAPQIVRLDM